jgi:hypothetical protein
MDEPPPTVAPVMEGTITLETASDYLDKWYRKRSDTGEVDREFGKSWAMKYRGLHAFLKKIGVLKEKKVDNFADILNNYEKLVKAINEMTVSIGKNKGDPVEPGTKLEKFKLITCHLDNNAGLRLQVSSDAYKAYKNGANETKVASNDRRDELNMRRSVFSWPAVQAAIVRRFGSDSLENLFFKYYDEVPTRADWYDLPIVKERLEDNQNYVFESKGKFITHLGHFKTVGTTIKPRDYVLSAALCKLIKENLEERKAKDRKFLFMDRRWEWVQAVAEEAGMVNYPYGISEHKSNEAMNGTRHTMVTYRNSRANLDSRNPKPSGSALAALMLHTADKAKTTYTNSSTFEDSAIRQPNMDVKFVRVKEGKKWFVGEVMEQDPEDHLWVIKFPKPEPEGAYTTAQVREFAYQA